MSQQVPSSILAFFGDPNASSVLTLNGQQVIAPIVRGADLTEEEVGMGGGVRIVMHVIDASPSMQPVVKFVIEGFGKQYVEAIKAARQDDVAALRLGGLVFSSRIEQIWKTPKGAFHPIDELPPLTAAEYDPDKGSGTALYQAIIDGYRVALLYAAEVAKQTGIQPEIDVIVLTDGMNNEVPQGIKGQQAVKMLIEGSKAELVRWIFFYFETSRGASESDNRSINPVFIAEDLGFDKENTMTFVQKKGESEKDLKSRFRRMLRIMSRVSASKGMSAVVAAGAVAAATAAKPGGDSDEELV